MARIGLGCRTVRWLWPGLLLTIFLATTSAQSDPATVQVVRVIDGDTIEVCCVFGDRVERSGF